MPDKMLDLQKIADMVHRIKTMNPRLVVNVGACCLTSDLCHHFAKNATIACSTSIPTTMEGNLVVCRKLRESDRELLNEMKPWQQCVESVFNYVMPGEKEMKDKFVYRERVHLPGGLEDGS